MKTNLIVSMSAITALLALTSCSSVRETLGLERSSPDEYAVTPSQVDLEMPPDFYKLPAPQPGTPRPQETSHTSTARGILTDSHSHSHSHSPSEGTNVLLQEAGVESGHDNIRAELYQEAEVEKRKGKSIAQQLGIRKLTPGQVLKPVEEQARLQQAGIETSKYVEEDLNDN